MFHQIGFTVRVQTNLHRNQFIKTLIEFSEEKHGDVMVLVVMSHGIPGGYRGKIIASNGQPVDIYEDIQKYCENITQDFLRNAFIGTSTTIPPILWIFPNFC